MGRFNRVCFYCRRLETAAPWPAAHHFFCGIMDPIKVARISIRVCRNGIYPGAMGVAHRYAV